VTIQTYRISPRTCQVFGITCDGEHVVKIHWMQRSYWDSATSRKVAGSTPDGVTGIFRWFNPSGLTMALRSTQPLTEMGIKATGAQGWQLCHLHTPNVWKFWEH